MAEKKKKYFYALGRRKTSSATVRLYEEKGISTINEKTVEEYYPTGVRRTELMEPFEVAGLNTDKFWFTVKVRGGGFSSQIGAIKLGLARAMVKMNEKNKAPLKQAGLLTRDPRMVERKKTGLRKARKREQFSKR